MESFKVSVVTPTQNKTDIVISDSSSAMCVYYAIFGEAFDPTKILVIFDSRVLNPFQPLIQQGVAEGSTIAFQYKASDLTQNQSKERNLAKFPSQQEITISEDHQIHPLIRAKSLVNVEIPRPKVIKRTMSDLTRKPIIHTFSASSSPSTPERSSYLDLILRNPEEDLSQSEDSILTEDENNSAEIEEFIRMLREGSEIPNSEQNNSSDEEETYDERPEEEAFANGIMREALRINDISYSKIDLSGNASFLYQHILQSQEPTEPPIDDLDISETVIPKTPSKISTEPLPIMWDTDTHDDQMYRSFCYEEMERSRKLSIKEASELANEHLESRWNW